MNEELTYDDEIERAADVALKLVGWDGNDPKPLELLMLALVVRHEEAGYGLGKLASWFTKIAFLEGDTIPE